MKSRLLAGTAAAVLALVGALMLYGYAQGAEARAVQGLDPVNVLVVAQPVPAGTPSEELMPFLATESLPATAVGPTALKDIASSTGKVTSVALMPGEQLLTERLVDPNDVEASSVAVPDGLQEISFTIEPDRAVGGKLVPGDTIGIFISLESGGLEDEAGIPTTKLALPKILVTSVQRSPTTVTPADPAADPATQARAEAEALPSGTLMLTVAVDADQATRIVHANQNASLWLSKQTETTADGNSSVVQNKELYR